MTSSTVYLTIFGSTLRNLPKDKSIITFKFDNGQDVIMDKLNYITKMNTILNDLAKFVKLTTADPLSTILNVEDKINYRLRKRKKKMLLTHLC